MPLGIDVNSDQNLNPAVSGKLCMKSWMLKPSVCRVEPFAGLKPSLAL